MTTTSRPGEQEVSRFWAAWRASSREGVQWTENCRHHRRLVSVCPDAWQVRTQVVVVDEGYSAEELGWPEIGIASTISESRSTKNMSSRNEVEVSVGYGACSAGDTECSVDASVVVVVVVVAVAGGIDDLQKPLTWCFR